METHRVKAFPKVDTYFCVWAGQVFLAEGLRTQRCLVISGTIEPRFGCRDSWKWGATPEGPGRPIPGRGRGGRVLTAQGLILVLAVGTGADAITDPAGRDAAPSVTAQEAGPVRQRHTGLGP